MFESDDPEGSVWAARIRDLQAELARHSGTLALSRRQAIRRAHGILSVNERELAELLDAPDSDHEIVVELYQNVRAPEVRDAYLQEFIRRIHNYLAAVKTLVDHTRRIMRDETDPSFTSEYESRVQKLSNEPLARFVQKLRDYFLHYGVPPFSQRVHVLSPGDEGHAFEVLLDPGTLLEWPDWPSKAKEYLALSEEAFDIRVPVQQYGQLVDDLYSWFFDAYQSAHLEEFEGLGQLAAQYNAHLASRADAADTTD